MNFPPTSRYYGIEITTLDTANGQAYAYLRRRFLPSLESFTLLQEHLVSQDDRLDNLSAQYLGDAEQSWRIADANNAMHPSELTEEIGRRLRITLPEGIPGNSNA